MGLVLEVLKENVIYDDFLKVFISKPYFFSWMDLFYIIFSAFVNFIEKTLAWLLPSHLSHESKPRDKSHAIYLEINTLLITLGRREEEEKEGEVFFGTKTHPHSFSLNDKKFEFSFYCWKLVCDTDTIPRQEDTDAFRQQSCSTSSVASVWWDQLGGRDTANCLIS